MLLLQVPALPATISSPHSKPTLSTLSSRLFHKLSPPLLYFFLSIFHIFFVFELRLQFPPLPTILSAPRYFEQTFTLDSALLVFLIFTVTTIFSSPFFFIHLLTLNKHFLLLLFCLVLLLIFILVIFSSPYYSFFTLPSLEPTFIFFLFILFLHLRILNRPPTLSSFPLCVPPHELGHPTYYPLSLF